MNETSEVETLDSQLTDLEPPYESDNEAKIGRLLDKYGIPFFYKQATIIYDKGKNEIWNPSFTLPQYGCAVIDYVDDSRKSVLEERINIHNYNQIPATVLGPPDLDKPNWQESLYEKLQHETGHLQDLSLYKAP
jgi:hypothetical protein